MSALPDRDPSRAAAGATSAAPGPADGGAGTWGAPTEPWWRRRGWRLWLAVALGLRVVFLVQLGLSDPLLRELLSDAAYYDGWARSLAAGEPFRPGLPHWLPPLYPWLLAGLYRLSGGALAVTLAVQALVGLGVAVAVARLAARVAGERAGLVAGWLWTLYLPTTFFETRLLGVNAALPLCLVALHAGLGVSERLAADRDGRWPALAAGLAAGLASLARPNLLLSLPCAGLGLLVAHRGRGPRRLLPALLAAALGLALGVLPGLASNLARSGRPVLVSANGGINFWFGNNPEAHGTFHAPGPEWGAIDEQRDVSLAIAAEALGRPVDEREASAWWSARGRAWLASDPAAAARLLGLKLADNLSSFEFGIQYVVSAVRARAPLLWLAPLPFGLLLALAVLAPGRVRHAAPLLGWIAAAFAAALLYFTYSRFRLPWLPALLPFSAVGLLRAVDWARGREPLRVGRALLAVLLLVHSYLPFEGDYPRLLERHGFEDAARAWVELGRDARAGGAEGRALSYFRRAHDLDPRSAAAVYELASLRLGARDPRRLDADEALALLEAAWQDAELLAAAEPVTLDALAVLHAAALLDRAPFEPGARARARALVEGVLARDPAHPGATALAERLR